MFGVIIGHMITALKAGYTTPAGTPFIHLFVRTYDMPLFILISGYFLKLTYEKYNNIKNIINKFTSILVPVLLWNTIFYIIKIPISGFSLKAYIVSLQNLWFLWATFICMAITLVICQISKNKKVRISLMALAVIVTLFIPKDIFNIAFVLPFFFIGFFFDEIEKISDNKKTALKTISVIMFIALLCFWKSDYNTWNAGSYILTNTKFTAFAILIRFFIGLFGSVTIMVLCDIILKSGNILVNKAVNIFVDIGRNTLGIYILQSFFVETAFAYVIKYIVAKFGVNYFVYNVNLLGFIIAPVISFVAIIIINWIVKLLKKIPKIGKYLFGFKIIDARKK